MGHAAAIATVVVRAFCANQLAVLLYDKYLLTFVHKHVSNGTRAYLIDPAFISEIRSVLVMVAIFTWKIRPTMLRKNRAVSNAISKQAIDTFLTVF